MKKESISYGVIGLLAGVLLMGFIASLAVNNNNQTMMQMMGMRTYSGQSMMGGNYTSMDQMMNDLQDKTGDDFDKAFMSEMIVHHQGAIDMARLAQTNAKHQEIKDMAKDILSAQSKEIDLMQTWQTDWGYKYTPQMQNNMTGN